MKPYMYLTLVFALIVLFTMAGCASTNTRLVTLNQSYHYDRESRYNESHNGIGVDYLFDKENNWRAGYIHFKNSQFCRGPASSTCWTDDRRRSHMLTVSKEWNPKGKLFIGLQWAVADAYGKESNKILAIGGVTFRWEFHPSFSIYSIVTPVLAADGFILQYQDGAID